PQYTLTIIISSPFEAVAVTPYNQHSVSFSRSTPDQVRAKFQQSSMSELVETIERLPIELLELIFIATCKIRPSPSVLDVKSFPWVAGQVCTRWRLVALRLPEIWSHIDLHFKTIREEGLGTRGLVSRLVRRTWNGGEGSEVRFDGDEWHKLPKSSAEIIKEYHFRSRSIPLTISITVVCAHDSGHPKVIANLLDIIGAHSEKWKSAFLSINSRLLTQSLFSQVNGQLSCLEKLTWHDYPPAIHIVAPKIVALDVPGRSITECLPSWAQLQQITVNSLRDLRLLQGSQQLQHLHLGEKPLPGTDPELTFNHLRSLSCYPTSLDAFLELPALEVLKLHPMKLESNSSRLIRPSSLPNSLPEFVRRITPQLKELDLPGFRTKKDSIIVIEALEMLPNLQILKLGASAHTIGAYSSLLKYMTIHEIYPDQSPLLHLQHLRISPIYESEMWVFLDMIQSRFSTKYDFPRLKSVQFREMDTTLWWNLLTDGTKRRIDELESRGLVWTRHRD
ncbi:hypothetical protein C8J56DRAFT_1090481, partial [Mycena floridula]